LLVSVKCHILGVVLNAVDSNAPDYYYSYRYYPYSYGYGPQEAGDPAHDRDEHGHPETVSESSPRNRDDDQAL